MHPPKLIEQLTGTVKNVTFHNKENGFCVLRIERANEEFTTVIASIEQINIGAEIECQGQWVLDKNHGRQFAASDIKILPPSSLAAIEKYLGSGLLKGVGPHFAKKLVTAFGKDVFAILDNEPARFMQLEGVSKKRKQEILQHWQAQKTSHDLMVFLQAHGIERARALRVYKMYGDNTEQLIRENPYRLALDIHGIGFKIADAVAEKLGVAREAPIRAQAGIHHVLKEYCNNGHCAAPIETLIQNTAQLLEINEAVLNSALTTEITAKRLVQEDIKGESCVFLSNLHRAEVLIAHKLLQLIDGAPPWGQLDLDAAIAAGQAKTGQVLSASQQAALKTILQHKVGIITGGPGVGKTTIVKTLLAVLNTKKMHIALCAPTGRAAKRLQETTDMPAKTIHRLLEYSPFTRAFKHNQDDPLLCDVLIIDETSMLDVNLLQHLLNAVSITTAVLFVGDVDQLPSVGSGQVLADMINSKVIPTVRLTEIFRQAASSKIIINAHHINEGELPLENDINSDFFVVYEDTPEAIHDKLIQLVSNRIPKRYDCNAIQDIQVLTPFNRGELGTHTLNQALQKCLNFGAKEKIQKHDTFFYLGDKVIQTINNYDKEVFNGDIGIIVQVDNAAHKLKVRYEDRLVEYSSKELDELNLAYAISIHKSQGSEYPIVIIPLAMQHYSLLARNLVYTAVTRGKQLVIVIAQRKALQIAVQKNQVGQRLTKLKERLQGDMFL
ncbi:MAG: ATP-dependent RecD-like DNA helicase [Gammaproteobacteria bacterium]|nr:ATP-dependent RecD-like DNA helicase [Gammaproteobacteria bacterium]